MWHVHMQEGSMALVARLVGRQGSFHPSPFCGQDQERAQSERKEQKDAVSGKKKTKAKTEHRPINKNINHDRPEEQ